MTGRKRRDGNLRLIDGALAPSEAPVQLGAGPHLLTSHSSPAGQVRFDPSLRTAADQMAEQLGREGVGRGA